MAVLGQSTTEFESSGKTPAEARRFVRNCLEGWGLSGVQEAVLAVSELATNAVEHGGDRVGVVVAVSSQHVRVEVIDDGDGGMPAMRTPDPVGDSADGLGLYLVDQIADKWGSDTRGGWTVVWFECPVTS